MNIFILDEDPKIAAQMLCDKHTGSKNAGGKMIVESAQMLANCYPLERLAKSDCPFTKTGNPRKHSYLHHPCSQWVMASQTNFEWLLEHALEMVQEKIYRGGNLHFSSHFINWCNVIRPTFAINGFTQPALAMPDFYKKGDPVRSYRAYYIGEKYKIATWTVRQIPEWFSRSTKCKNQEK